jgi:hypothetical protein
MATFAGKGCHMVSMTDPSGRIPGFLDRRVSLIIIIIIIIIIGRFNLLRELIM